VSHKLSEVLEISEKVAVLRDGMMVGDFETNELDTDKLVYHMTGKEIVHSIFQYESKKEKAVPLLELKGLTKKPNYASIDMSLFRGEILGITGLLGSGRTELALSLFGLNRPQSGQIRIDGQHYKIRTPRDAIRAGISYLPEDRHSQGLFLQQSIGVNLIVTILKRLLNKFGIISRKKRLKSMTMYVEDLRIKTPSLEAPAESLSGGNQQRVVLGKWLATNPRIFILDGPTVGIDIASKSEIHQLIKSLAKKGMGIIVISDEINEVFHNCNRILVMKNGRIAAEVDPLQTTERELTELVEKKDGVATS
jgi:simple sugar transport system ATP-binding protein